MVVDIWQEVLRSDSIGLNDNFFSLGGHSLLATQIVARVGERVGKSISLRSLFDNPTVEQFAARVAELVSQQTSASAALPAIRPRAKTGHPPGH
jgi:acyl carrier protein